MKVPLSPSKCGLSNSTIFQRNFSYLFVCLSLTYKSNMNVYIENNNNFILMESNDIIFLFINTILQNFGFLLLRDSSYYLSLIFFDLNYCWRLPMSPSDDAHRRQFGMAVFHEPRIDPQAHGIPLQHFTREYTGVSFIFPQGRR